MYIEVGVPAVLPLALANLGSGSDMQPLLLCAALAHPPIHLRAQPSETFSISGPRTQVAVPFAQKLYHQVKPKTLIEIEIEHAIPAFMGLGSEIMLEYGVAHALRYYNQPSVPETGAEAAESDVSGLESFGYWAAKKAGLFVTDLGKHTRSPIYRAEPDSSENNAWGLVLFLPRVENDLDDELERDRMALLSEAAQTMTPRSAAILQKVIWPAIESDKLTTFGAGLMELRSLSIDAMTAVGIPSLVDKKGEQVLRIMQEQGAVAWGQSLAGYCYYAFSRGARSTIDMRIALREVVGHDDGQMMATIIDSQGLQIIEKEGAMKSSGTLLDTL